MIERTFCADRVNAIVNSPSVRPTVGGEGFVDCSQLIADRRNVFLISGDDGACFIWKGPRVFEAHSFFVSRGRAAIDMGKAMLEWIGDCSDLVWAATPLELRAARWFNRQIGLKSLGEIETPDGPCELFEKRN